MKKFSAMFLWAGLMGFPVFGDSLLKATSFPATFEDVDFTDRLEIIKDGYEPYAAEYDNDGFCVKNCAYPGLNIKQEEYIVEKDTEEAVQESEEYEKSIANNTVNNDGDNNAPNNLCVNRNPDIPVGQKVPWGEPLMGKPKITSKFGPRVLNGVNGYHDGIDYSAKIGTPVYAPADGRVTATGLSGNCGNMVQLQHADGMKTIYCHLSSIHVRKGDYVWAGCSFAKTGNTGRSTGPHLHYAMKNAAGKKIDPSAYTKRSGA